MAAKKDKDKEIIDTIHEHGVHIPTRTIWLESSRDDEGDEHGVNYTMMQTFSKNLFLLEHLNNKEEITILLYTDGGDSDTGMAIYDMIRNSPCPITVKVMGLAQSMGSVILQAADWRVLMPHSQVMFHYGSGYPKPESIQEAENAIKAAKAWNARVDQIIYDRMQEKALADEKKGISHERFEKMNWFGKYMNAEEAIELGLADEIEQPPSRSEKKRR